MIGKTPDYYFNVLASLNWTTISARLDTDVELLGIESPGSAANLPDSLRPPRTKLVEIFGERYPLRTRGALRYEILATDEAQAQSHSSLRVFQGFEALNEPCRERTNLVLNETGLYAFREETSSETAYRKELARLDIWQTLDFLAVVEAGRHSLPPPKMERQLAMGDYSQSATFDPMPWAPDFDLRLTVNLSHQNVPNSYELENDAIKFFVTIEPHLDMTYSPLQYGATNPIRNALEAVSKK